MKKILFVKRFLSFAVVLFLCILFCKTEIVLAEKRIPIDEENFPNERFRKFVEFNVNLSADNYLTENEIAEFTEFDATELNDPFEDPSLSVSDLTGIEHFIYLEKLNCKGMNLKKLNISGFTELVYLDCTENEIEALDLSECKKLQELYCYENKLQELDLSNCESLVSAFCQKNELRTIDVSGVTSLEVLFCYSNQLKTLDVTTCTALRRLECSNNELNSLDVSKCSKLNMLEIGFNNILSIDVSKCAELELLNIRDNPIVALDVSGNPKLTYVQWFNNVRNVCAKDEIFLSDLGIDFTKAKNWENVVYDAKEHKLTGFMQGNKIYYSYDIGLGEDSLATFCIQIAHVDNNADGCCDSCGLLVHIPIDAEHFPDANFRAYILERIDRNKNGRLEYEEEILNTQSIYVSNRGIKSLQGIEYFERLTDLNCNNNEIIQLDLGKLYLLKYLSCGKNFLKSLDVSKNSELEVLICNNNSLSNLDICTCSKLVSLDCSVNKISDLDIHANNALISLFCRDNELRELNLSGKAELIQVECDGNHISVLDFSEQGLLKSFSVTKNPLISLKLNPAFDFQSEEYDELKDGQKEVLFAVSTANPETRVCIEEGVTSFFIEGADFSKISKVSGATFHPATGEFTNFTTGQAITYVYDTGYMDLEIALIPMNHVDVDANGLCDVCSENDGITGEETGRYSWEQELVNRLLAAIREGEKSVTTSDMQIEGKEDVCKVISELPFMEFLDVTYHFSGNTLLMCSFQIKEEYKNSNTFYQAFRKTLRMFGNITLDTEEGLSDLQKIVLIHDRLLMEVDRYSSSIWVGMDGYEAIRTKYGNAKGALTESKAISSGYTTALQSLLHSVGVECQRVKATKTLYEWNADHEWNLVKIGDEWYHIDAAWNDMGMYSENSYQVHPWLWEGRFGRLNFLRSDFFLKGVLTSEEALGNAFYVTEDHYIWSDETPKAAANATFENTVLDFYTSDYQRSNDNGCWYYDGYWYTFNDKMLLRTDFYMTESEVLLWKDVVNMVVVDDVVFFADRYGVYKVPCNAFSAEEAEIILCPAEEGVTAEINVLAVKDGKVIVCCENLPEYERFELTILEHLNLSEIRAFYRGNQVKVATEIEPGGYYVAGYTENGYEIEIPIEACEVTEWDTRTAGMKQVTVTYGGLQDEFTVVVQERSKEEVERLANIEAFVVRLYELVLNRTPDADGIETWTSALLNGSLTGVQVAQGFLMSEEFLGKDMTNEEYVRIMYRAFFNREADPEGFSTWMDSLNNGFTKRFVFAGFANSDEFITLCNSFGVTAGSVHLMQADYQPNLSEQDYNIWCFVERLYAEVLGRGVDQDGLMTWVNVLKDGSYTGAQVAEGFIMSQEFQGKRINFDVYVRIMYSAFFGRPAGESEVAFWVSLMEDGYSKQFVFAGFANSDEFGRLCDSYGILCGSVSATE